MWWWRAAWRAALAVSWAALSISASQGEHVVDTEPRVHPRRKLDLLDDAALDETLERVARDSEQPCRFRSANEHWRGCVHARAYRRRFPKIRASGLSAC